MKEKQHITDEISALVSVLETMGDDPSDDDRNRLFADCHATRTAELLEELRAWRDKAAQEEAAGGRVIVEGFDTDSMEAAFGKALNKAAGFFDAHHDISVTVIGLVKMPKGGYHATLEVEITPLSYRPKIEPDSLEEETLARHNLTFATERKLEEEHTKDLVLEHFLETTGAAPHVPDYFLINFKDADLLNHMIEKQFFNAGRTIKRGPEPLAAVVQVIKPEPED